MDIAAWLHGLGLAQYETAFRENAIDSALLPNLTVEDLKDLGVILVGHRRRLLDAIAALRAESVAPPPADSAGSAPERRQLTVMFCDLVGSTPLSARLDPEDLREIVGAYHRCVADTVARFAGFVAKYMGDGVLIISAIRKLMKTMPNGESVLGLLLSTQSAGWTRQHL